MSACANQRGIHLLVIARILSAVIVIALLAVALAACADPPAIGDINYDASVALIRYENLDDGVSGVVYRQVNRFTTVLAESQVPLLVVFYASLAEVNNRVQPMVEQLADDYQGQLQIVWIDANAEEALAQSFGVTELPQFTVVVEGAVKRSLVGYGEGDALKVRSLISPYLTD